MAEPAIAAKGLPPTVGWLPSGDTPSGRAGDSEGLVAPIFANSLRAIIKGEDTPMPEPGVFISYARDTKPLAESLSRALEERGIASWAGFKDLQPGQRWREEVERALKYAGSFLILVGPDSSPSPSVQAEWQAVLTKVWSDPHKVLIPVVFGAAEPPPFLRNWVSLRVDPGTEPSKWIPRVVDALESRRTEVAGRASPDAQAERIERWQEIGRAARLLRESEPDSETPAGLQG